jgi:hypothetical protein
MGYTKGRVPLEKAREIMEIPVDGLGRYCGASKWAVNEEKGYWLVGAAYYDYMDENGEIYTSDLWCFNWKEVIFFFHAEKIYNTKKLDHTLKLTYEIYLETRYRAFPPKETEYEKNITNEEHKNIYTENLEEIKMELIEAFKIYGDDGDERDETLPENVTVVFKDIPRR